MATINNKPKILYDGKCELCKSSIEFIDDHGGHDKFEFIPLESREGKIILKDFGYPEDYNDSVLLIEDNKKNEKSEAVFEILHRLKSPWAKLSRLKMIPRPLRDFFYNLVSRYRHKKIVQKLMRKIRKNR